MSDRPPVYGSPNPSSLPSNSQKINYEQGSLFAGDSAEDSQSSLKRSLKLHDSSTTYDMGSASLQAWKQAIANHQSSVSQAIPVQTSLFDLPNTHCDPHAINPFSLPIYPAEFYRLPNYDRGDACVYFVIDLIASTRSPVLLYIGESCRSYQRWKGVHDCKRYLLNYRELHITHNLPTQVVMTFWWDAPLAAKPRQQLERILIEKWRSPFNKENWSFWGTPFVS